MLTGWCSSSPVSAYSFSRPAATVAAPMRVDQGQGADRVAAAEAHRGVDVIAGGVAALVHRRGVVEVRQEQCACGLGSLVAAGQLVDDFLHGYSSVINGSCQTNVTVPLSTWENDETAYDDGHRPRCRRPDRARRVRQVRRQLARTRAQCGHELVGHDSDAIGVRTTIRQPRRISSATGMTRPPSGRCTSTRTAPSSRTSRASPTSASARYKLDGDTISLIGDDGNTDKGTVKGDTLVFRLGTLTKV